MKKLIIKVTEIQTIQLIEYSELLKLYISFSVGKPLDIKWKATSDNVKRAKHMYDTIRKALEKGSPYAEVLEEEEYNLTNNE